jgi:hypothetical protein
LWAIAFDQTAQWRLVNPIAINGLRQGRTEELTCRRCLGQNVVDDHFAERADVTQAIPLLWTGDVEVPEQQLGDPV